MIQLKLISIIVLFNSDIKELVSYTEVLYFKDLFNIDNNFSSSLSIILRLDNNNIINKKEDINFTIYKKV